MNTLKGYKTLLFNILMLALASPDLLSLIPPKAALYILPIGNLILRAITTTPLGRSEPKINQL